MGLYTATAAALAVQVAVAHGVAPAIAIPASAACVTAGARALWPHANVWRTLAVALCSAAVFAAVAVSRESSPDADDVTALLASNGRSATTLSLVADVVEPPRARRYGASAVVEARALRGFDGEVKPIHGRVALSLRNASGRVRFGDRIAFRARLARITNFGNPGEFDYAAWCARRAVYVSAFVWDDRDVEPLGPAPDASVILRARTRIASAALGARGAAGAMTAALVVGDGSALGPDVMETIRISGLSHLLAISGMNVGVVAYAALWLCGRLIARTRLPASGRDPFRPAAAAAAAAVVAYAALSGGGESVVRATIMSLAVLAALWRGRAASAGRAMAVAALALGVCSPGAAAEAGFQLSFAATAVILAWAPMLRALKAPAPLRAGFAAFTIGLLCWAVTAPILAYHFERVSLVAPAAGIVTGLPSALVVVAGLIGAALLPVSERLAACAFDAAAWGGTAILETARIAAAPGWAEQILVNPGAPVAAALAVLPLIGALPAQARRRALAAAAAVIVAGSAERVHARYRADRIDVVFASVGQGDATVLRLPGGQVAVVDGGPPGRGRTAVAPLLRRMSIARIDVLVATHVQDDHWGGLPELAEEFEIGELWYPGGACRQPRFADFLESLRRRGVPLIDVGAELAARDTHGARRAAIRRRGAAGWTLRALWPREGEGQCDDNDRSVVVLAAFGRSRLLLGGDIERGAEERIARLGRLRAGVLKAPHHGSRTSSSDALLDAVRPAIAVASCGVLNRYGFPHEQILARYASRGVSLLRTDRAGAVSVRAYRDRLIVAPALDGRPVEIARRPRRRGLAAASSVARNPLRQSVD